MKQNIRTLPCPQTPCPLLPFTEKLPTKLSVIAVSTSLHPSPFTLFSHPFHCITMAGQAPWCNQHGTLDLPRACGLLLDSPGGLRCLHLLPLPAGAPCHQMSLPSIPPSGLSSSITSHRPSCARLPKTVQPNPQYQQTPCHHRFPFLYANFSSLLLYYLTLNSVCLLCVSLFIFLSPTRHTLPHVHTRM